jgi:superfamily II DNA/RNA helicase
LQGIDLSDIALVIQWKASCDMCTLWQRFGHGARGLGLEVIALFLVEPMYFDRTKEQKAERKAKKDEKKEKQKIGNALVTGSKQKQNEQNDSHQVRKNRKVEPTDWSIMVTASGSQMLGPLTSAPANRPTNTSNSNPNQPTPPADTLTCLWLMLLSHSFIARALPMMSPRPSTSAHLAGVSDDDRSELTSPSGEA